MEMGMKFFSPNILEISDISEFWWWEWKSVGRGISTISTSVFYTIKFYRSGKQEVNEKQLETISCVAVVAVGVAPVPSEIGVVAIEPVFVIGLAQHPVARGLV